VVKVILKADDCSGTIGDLARQLLEIHEQVCDAGVAVGVYSRLIESILAAADKRACRTAIRDLERARRAVDAASLSEEFDDDVTALRELRRRPTLIAMLDKAGLRWRWEPGAEDSGRKSRPGRSRRPRTVTL